MGVYLLFVPPVVTLPFVTNSRHCSWSYDPSQVLGGDNRPATIMHETWRLYR